MGTRANYPIMSNKLQWHRNVQIAWLQDLSVFREFMYLYISEALYICSLSYHVCYYNVSRNHETTRLDVKMDIPLWNLTDSATRVMVTPPPFQLWAKIWPELHISRPRDFTRYEHSSPRTSFTVQTLPIGGIGSETYIINHNRFLLEQPRGYTNTWQ